MTSTKTSATHPLEIASLALPEGGVIGLTFCPGKCDIHAHNGPWARDLPMDLGTLRAWGAQALVSLLEDHEFDLLDAQDQIGVKLTETYAMWPAASVSGFYLAHPDARYFAVAKIDRDQVADYARRKGWDVSTAEKWLAPNLGYEP